jgi:hypothetical protein
LRSPSRVRIDVGALLVYLMADGKSAARWDREG